jgi:hypothetical protein
MRPDLPLARPRSRNGEPHRLAALAHRRPQLRIGGEFADLARRVQGLLRLRQSGLHVRLREVLTRRDRGVENLLRLGQHGERLVGWGGDVVRRLVVGVADNAVRLAEREELRDGADGLATCLPDSGEEPLVYPPCAHFKIQHTRRR